MAKELATYTSSNSITKYIIREGKDGVIYCDCPAWKFSKPHNCRHLIDYHQSIHIFPAFSKLDPVQAVKIPISEHDDIISRIKTGVWK